MYDFSFLKGSIETIILNALYSGDKYGYEIAREIKEKTENKYEIKQPTLYGYLKRLEQSKLILSYWGGGDSNGGRRRYYKLTEQGKNVCLEYMSEWNFQRDIIDSLVAQPDKDEIKEISQENATSILGTKTKRTRKQREIISNFDLEEVNKQLSSLQNPNPQQKDEPKIAPQIQKPEVIRYEVAPDPYRPNATVITPYTTPISAKKVDNEDNTANDEIKQEEALQEPKTPSINDQLKNMAPAGPQLIFAPTEPNPIITSSSFENKNKTKETYYIPKQEKVNNSPIITNSVFFASSAKSAPITTEQPKEEVVVEQKNQPKQQILPENESQYKNILGNLLENQFDQMSKATFNSPDKFDDALNNQTETNKNNDSPVPMKTVVKDLEKSGIKAVLYNSKTANSYVSTPMIFTNKMRCYLAVALALTLILEYVLMYTIFKSAVPDLKFTLFTILIILTCLSAGGFVANYILHPIKKSKKSFNFKFHFINSWIFVGSILAIVAIIYFVIIGVGEVKQLLLDFVLPFVISLNAPLGVFYYNILLKFQ